MNHAVRGAVAAVALSLLALFGPALAQPLFSPAQDPVAGSRIFRTKGCAKCHAIEGAGGKIGPDLARIPRPRSFYDLAAAMWNHLPQMAEKMRQLGIHRPRLDQKETGNLIAFLYTLNYFDPPGNAQAGRGLFMEKKCVACHQVGGTGGVVGPNLDAIAQVGSPIFVAAAVWNHGPAMEAIMRDRGVERPTFKDRELVDLIAYLKSVAPPLTEGPLHVLPGRSEEGRRLFSEKRCIQCHSIRGEGGQVGPDLAERGLHQSLTQFAAAMWNKEPAMREAMRTLGIEVPQLTAEEVANLVAYLYAVQYFAEPGDPKKGREVVEQKGCLGCHSLKTRGGRTAGDLARAKGLDSPPAVISALWNHAFIMKERVERRKVSWPQLQPEEVADLVAFFGSPGRK